MVDVIIEIEQGKLQGRIALDHKDGKYYSFQGIPYGKPPVGGLRFKAPVAAGPWKGIRDATREASESLANHLLFQDKVVGSEDCLYLNVYTPALPKDAEKSLKPVMFWIHGGGFNMGSSKSDLYGPEYLISEDVLLVTINYRLGILGFLKVDDPTLGVPGNAGLKDMVLALKWVQRNIAKFGGDPKNVTIFGESAGGAAVHCLMLSPMAKGLFHRAILQSGCALNPWVFGGEKPASVAKILGCESEDEKEILEFLKSVPAVKILEAQNKINDPSTVDEIRPFGVVVENSDIEPVFFSQNPVDIIKSGNYNKVPIIIGYTSREGLYMELEHIKLFGELKITNNFETSIPYYYNVPKGTELSLKIANKIKEAYFGSSTPSLEHVDEYFQLLTDVIFFRGIYKSITFHLSSLNLPIYFYLLSADTEANLVKSLRKLTRSGASHADDLGYLFKTAFLPEFKENTLEYVIIQRMVKLWTNFAKNANPNPVESDPLIDTLWKPVAENHFNCLDIGSDLKCIENPDISRMKVWDEISTILSNVKN